MGFKEIKYRFNTTKWVPEKYFTNRFKNLLENELSVLDKYVSDGDTILDIGSETGRIGFLITDVLNKKPSELFLTEINDKFVEKLKLNVSTEEENYYNIKVLKENMMSFSNNIKNNYFDCVTSLGDVFNLHGNPNPISVESHLVFRAIKKSIEKLKVGGKLIFSLNLNIINGLDEENIESELFSIGLKLLKSYKAYISPLNVNGKPLTNYRYIYCFERIK